MNKGGMSEETQVHTVYGHKLKTPSPGLNCGLGSRKGKDKRSLREKFRP